MEFIISPAPSFHEGDDFDENSGYHVVLAETNGVRQRVGTLPRDMVRQFMKRYDELHPTQGKLMSGQHLECEICGWKCRGEKGMELEEAHTDCPGYHLKSKIAELTGKLVDCERVFMGMVQVFREKAETAPTPRAQEQLLTQAALLEEKAKNLLHPTAPEKVNVLVALTGDANKQVLDGLVAAGLHIDQVLPAIKTVTGSLNTADVGRLRLVPGVASVDTDRTVSIPTPVSPLS